MQTGHNTPQPIEKFEIHPIKYCVLIEPIEIEDKSAGGIYLPENVREKHQHAIDRGVITAMSENAFQDTTMWNDPPKVGDTVLFDKYAGSVIHKGQGRDRKIIRICNDTEILAILR